MRFLHTSDWHVGKTLKGRSRLDEQRVALGRIVTAAREHEVDAVLIAGDLYDTAAPSAEAQQLVIRALLALRDSGAQVFAIAGNHDSAPTFEAYRPLMNVAGIQLVGAARPPSDGGILRFTARSTGEPVDLAVLPFVSQRYAVRAAQLVAATPAENAASYDALVRATLDVLARGFRDDAIALVMSHLTVTGAAFGGGERQAQSIFEYHVPAQAFPAESHYVALGHLHRRQALPAACPVHYSGSPYPIDFGESENTNVALLVDVGVGTPARVTDLPIGGGRGLRTVRGTLDELAASAAEFGDDYLRVYLRQPAAAGLREQVVEVLPNALEVRIDPAFAAPRTEHARPVGAESRTPGELFREYLASQQIADERVAALFAELHDEVGA